MRASSPEYRGQTKLRDRVISSWDGYSSYLLIVDEASRYIWVFLTKSKDPPIDIVETFLGRFGHEDGGVLSMDQGGELARSFNFGDKILQNHKYVLEPTGADSPSQNGAAEIYNAKLAVRARTLLFGSGLQAKPWSSALIHAVYLYKHLVHTVTQKTPFEAMFGMKPDLSALKVFGSQGCVKRSGKRQGKLDRHDFEGIFLGYTATDQNIVYLDLDTGVVKSSHHAQFDEAWYLQPVHPPAPQLLYDLGVRPKEDACTEPTPVSNVQSDYCAPGTLEKVTIPWPPLAYCIPHKGKWHPPPQSLHLHLPLRTILEEYHSTTARAARAKAPTRKDIAAGLVDDFQIGKQDMALIYMSPNPYHEAFLETIHLQKFDPTKHSTAGLEFYESGGRLHLHRITPSTPAAKIPDWRSQVHGAWQIKVNNKEVSSIEDVALAFRAVDVDHRASVSLLFSHPEIRPNLSKDGLPIVSSSPFSLQVHGQLNNRWEFTTVAEHLTTSKPTYTLVNSGDVLNVTTRVMRLTWGKLLKQPDWEEWQMLEFLQLDQYDAQGMFGQPVPQLEDMAVFHSVWTYAIKAVDSRKKAHWACDGSPRLGQAKILDETYANCVDQTSARLFYAIAAAENLMIYGADVSNAFAEAPPPKQGICIHPDRAFHEWWVNHKKRTPIPPGAVISILSAMQGHPESRQLWEKHVDAILRECGLTPTVHEPCLYSGLIDGR